MNVLESSHPELLPSFLLGEYQPVIPATCFLAPGATVLGAATLGELSSIWYGAVIRADIQRINVGFQSNVQDGAVLHVADAWPCLLGERVTVGHRAVVHACEIGDEVLVGMGAIVLDGAVVGPRSVIAAGAVVTKGMQVPEGSLVVGTPGRVVRQLSLEERAANARLALKYVELSRRYREMGLAR